MYSTSHGPTVSRNRGMDGERDGEMDGLGMHDKRFLDERRMDVHSFPCISSAI